MGATCSSESSVDVQNFKGTRDPKEFSNVGFSNVPHEFIQHYRLGKTLGSGNYSTVRLAYHKLTHEKVAVKIVKKEGLLDVDAKALCQEVEILRAIDHPNIVKCLDFFDEPRHYYVVLEYMEGGELLERIIQRTTYNEKDARDVVKLVLKAIKHCHDRNIVHRDLKPENLLLRCEECDYDIKVADFGFASKKGDLMRTQVGTPEYIAPEILDGMPYSKGVDMWAIGCITYVLLGGYTPFQGKNLKTLFHQIRNASYTFPINHWGRVSSEAIDFINSLLKVDPTKRMNVNEALNHPWLIVEDESLRRSLSSSLRTLTTSAVLKGKSRFRSVVLTVIACHKLRMSISTRHQEIGVGVKYLLSLYQ